jgi:hypothetical protein
LAIDTLALGCGLRSPACPEACSFYLLFGAGIMLEPAALPIGCALAVLARPLEPSEIQQQS